MAGPGRQQQPVNIFFAVRGSRGYLLGSEVTNLLLRLTMVEFSYYMGFPVLEIAERESYCGSYHSLIQQSIFNVIFIFALNVAFGGKTQTASGHVYLSNPMVLFIAIFKYLNLFLSAASLPLYLVPCHQDYMVISKNMSFIHGLCEQRHQ